MKQKKFLAVVTAATMITANSISPMPDKFVNLPVFNANAADIVASGECGAEGNNVIWQLDSEGTLTVSGTGEMGSWALNSPWSEHSANISKVIIEKGVTAIGEQAFADCTALTSATISDSVTSIGDYAFYSCNNLTSITIPDSVTSIEDKAFQYCENLTSINVDSENKNYVSEDGVLFNEDKSMLIHYPAGKTTEVYIIPDGVTSISDEAFSGCNILTTITIPDSVISIGDKAFSDFTGLTTITIPDSVTSIGDEAFSDCISLTTITIPDSVTSIGDSVFCYCVSLTSITIPDSVTSIGSNAFSNCGSLATITIPDSVTSIGSNAFSNCTSLATITIPDSVTSIGNNAFIFCENLTTITINNPECDIYNSKNTISDTATIYGYTNSSAKAYAEKYNRTFVALDDEKLVTTTTITNTSTSTTTTTTVAVEGNVSWQMPEVTVEKGTEIIEVPVLLLDYDNSQLAVSSAEFTLTYDYNALDLVELTSKSDAYCTDTIFTSAINQFSIEIGSGNAIAGEHLANVVVFRFRIKDMSLNQDYFIRIENFCAYDANGRNISDHIKTNDGRIRLVEKITTTTTASTTANSTTTTTTPPVTTEPYFILGDINADGSIDSSDASLVLAEYAKIQTGGAETLTITQLESADVNNDNVVDSSDASKILDYYAMVSTGKKPTWD